MTRRWNLSLTYLPKSRQSRTEDVHRQSELGSGSKSEIGSHSMAGKASHTDQSGRSGPGTGK